MINSGSKELVWVEINYILDLAVVDRGGGIAMIRAEAAVRIILGVANGEVPFLNPPEDPDRRPAACRGG